MIGAATGSLQNFLETVIDLQEQEGDDSRGVQLSNENNRDSDVQINSLVFRLQPPDDASVAPIPRGFPIPSSSSSSSSSYVLAVLASDDFVNASRLDEVIRSRLGLETDERRPLLALAPSSRVVDLCGFEPGTVPPFGLSPPPILTVVDKSLLEQSRHWMVGGGGISGQYCRFQLDVLLGMDRVVVEDFRDQRNQNKASESEGVLSYAPSSFFSTIKPFFPVETPALDVAKQVIKDSAVHNPLKPVDVSFVGRLGRVRRMARRLVFCDVMPLEADTKTTDENKVDHTWRSAVTGQDMSVQLIAGKTLCQHMGIEQGEQMLRKGMQRGQIVWIRGKTNVGNRESLRNWVEKQSMDIVVWDCTIMVPDLSLLDLSTPTPKAAVTRQPSSEHSTSMPGVIPDDEPRTYRGKERTLLPPGMTPLRLEHVFSTQHKVVVIESIETVREFSRDLNQLMTKDNYGVELAGLDCEWKPNFLLETKEEVQPVLVLQISLHSLEKVYLWDLQSLLRPLLDPKEPLTSLEEEISEVFSTFFGSTRFVKVGFQLINDIRRLAASYPHLSGFANVEAVLELSTFAKKSMYMSQQSNSRTITSSLRSMVEYFLGYGLDKTEQISDWSQRPLSDSQKEYAALDAAVTPLLLQKAMESIQARIFVEPKLQVGRWLDDTAFSRAIQSWRFLFLDPDNLVAIRRLQAKRTVGDSVYVVSQCWRTNNVPPLEPSVPTEDGPYTDASGIFKIPSKLVYLKGHENQVLTVINQYLGTRLAKTKDRCVAALLRGVPAVAEQLENGARLDFPQRSGYVEFADASVLFVNMPMRPWARKARSYPNEWLEDGQILTWFLRENEWKKGSAPFAENLLDPTRPVYLFVRAGKGHFLCCGRCRVVQDVSNTTNKKNWDLVKLYLTLLDWKDLIGSSEFLALVNPGKYTCDNLFAQPDDDSSLISSSVTWNEDME